MRGDGLETAGQNRVRPGPPLLGALIFAAFAINGLFAARAGTNRTSSTPPRRGDPHGRGARHPGEIPKRGWRDIALRVKDDIGRTNLSFIAAGMAFFGFMAIPSALAALVALYGLVFDPHDVERQLQALAGMLPQDAVKILSDQLESLTSRPRGTIGIGFAISIGVALWSSRSATSALITGLNIAYGESEKRSFLKFQMTALGLTVAAVLFIWLALALIAVLPAVMEFLPLGQVGKTVASLVRWPLLAAIVMVALAALYRYAPCRAEPRWSWVSWGAVAATVIWILGSALFSVYVSKFASYDKTYGSLGAVVVMLMWLYLSAFAVFLGAELNAEIERQTARDSTTGEPEPMGRRGATAADTVGEAR